MSEIEPELLFAVERRMKGDQWHDGKFTVVPKTTENRGLNFLDCSAADYLSELKRYLTEKGKKPDKPLAFLCNPPYRSDDDQAAETITYKIHPSIIEVTNADASSERYCCFLAQMKLICEAAEDSGLPGDSLLLLFTKSAWLTKRSVFQSIRTHMLGVCENIAGILINGREFFDVKGSWPVAFTVWRHKGQGEHLDPYRSVPLIDLTWLKKEQLAAIPWNDPERMAQSCQQIIDSKDSKRIELGRDRTTIKDWSQETRHDFMRSRRKVEKNQKLLGGLPLDDRRQSGKKAYGETNGLFIGFMDDLTPCRIKASVLDKPWFRLNAQFMDIKKNRCFSGPPTNRGYCASDLTSAKKLFFWYSLARTFLQHPYPMWVDADDMWSPNIPADLAGTIWQTAFAIGYAENECIEARFPANNPVKGLPELLVRNPMTPLNPESFWSVVMRPYVEQSSASELRDLVRAVDELFQNWKKRFRSRKDLRVTRRSYLLDDAGLSLGAGITQIKDFATETSDQILLANLMRIQVSLRSAKSTFFDLITGSTGLNYFGSPKKSTASALLLPEKTKFDKVLAKRLVVAGTLVDALSKDPNFGRTKLAKLFYLADVHEGLSLGTDYYREAAGPLDQRALYNQNIGIESLARKYKLFSPEAHGQMVRYVPSSPLKQLVRSASQYLGSKADGVKRIAGLFQNLTTDQSEIIATLYACWNDFLVRKRKPKDEDIVEEFLSHWHPKKERFSKKRLLKALDWMRVNNLVPVGHGKLTSIKPQMPEQETD